MTPFIRLTGIAAPLDESDVDTNQLCPTRFNQVQRGPRFAEILFHDRRFTAGGVPRPDFMLNQRPFDRAVILVAGRNFGCGSSRETAVYGLLEFGIRAVVAESFADIFRTNAQQNGLLPVELDAARIRWLLDSLRAAPGTPVEIDLPRQTLTVAGEAPWSFAMHPLVKARLLAGLDEIALTRRLGDRIDAFEADYLARTPWMIQRPADAASPPLVRQPLPAVHNRAQEHDMETPAKFVRVMSTRMKKETIDAAAAEWVTHIAPFKAVGLERAFMLVDRATGDYLSVTIWESREAQERNVSSQSQTASRDEMTRKYFESTPKPSTFEIVGMVE